MEVCEEVGWGKYGIIAFMNIKIFLTGALYLLLFLFVKITSPYALESLFSFIGITTLILFIFPIYKGISITAEGIQARWISKIITGIFIFITSLLLMFPFYVFLALVTRV